MTNPETLLKFLVENTNLTVHHNPDGSECYDFTVKVGKSLIRLTKDGDVIINAGRHILLSRQLYFDNCDPSLVDKAIKAYSEGKEEYHNFLLSSENKLEYEEAVR